MTFTIARVLILAGGLIANVGGGGGAAWAQETRGFFADPGHGSWQSVNIGTNFTVIQRFSALPPGKYLAHASAVLASSDPLFRYVDCGFTIGRNLQSDLARGVVGGRGSTTSSRSPSPWASPSPRRKRSRWPVERMWRTPWCRNPVRSRSSRWIA